MKCFKNCIFFLSFSSIFFTTIPTSFGQPALFDLKNSDLPDESYQYSPTNIDHNWLYTQVNNETVVINSLGTDKEVPVSGFNLRTQVVTGFGLASGNGLIAISIGDRNTVMPNKLKNNKIWFGYQDGKGFASKYFAFQLNTDQYSCTTPFISKDGTKLYFASDMPGGYGGFDIYVCDYRGKEWSRPRNLGSVINTPSDEVYPYMVDNVLFFSSNGHGGKRFDVFLADMGNDKGRLVINPGVPVNSDANDYAMTFDNISQIGYVLSDRDGLNGKPYQLHNIQKLLILNIRSNNTQKPISGTKIDLSRCKKQPQYANVSGSVILPVDAGTDCFVNIEKVGYNSTVFKLDDDDIKGLKKSIDIYLSEEGVFYTGRIIDESGNPASEVEIAIVDQATGEIQYCYSDEYGLFRAALEPLSFYLFRTKSPYYDQAESKISTKASVPRDIIGTLTLKSNGRIIPKTNTNVGKPVDTGMNERESASESVASSKEKVYEAPVSTTSTTSMAVVPVENETASLSATPIIVTPPSEIAPSTTFAIQLAAVGTHMTDMSSYQDKLNKFGKVYFVKDGNYNKIRLGYFATSEDAKAMKNKLPKEFSNSFVIEEKKMSSEMMTAQTKPVNLTTPTKDAKSETDQMASPTTSSVISSETNEAPVKKINPEYKIRLSTLKDPNLFNGSKVKDLGLIEEVKTGNLVVFYLSGFENIEEVKITLPKVLDLGFPTAHIVEYAMGEYSKYAE